MNSCAIWSYWCKNYFALIIYVSMKTTYQYKPLKTKVDYQEAMKELEKVFHAKRGTPEWDHLEILILLIDAYEKEHFPIPDPDPIWAIQFKLDQMGMNVSDFGKIIKYQSRASEILNRKRKLTLGMIRAIHKELWIGLDILVQEYELA